MRKEVKSNKIQRSFIVGDQWLYYKIYTGAKTSDRILTELVKPITQKLLKKGVIEKWFFIRYSDPSHHLRLRFQCSSSQNLMQAIDALYPLLKIFLDHDLIWKVQIDSYHRELERYGSRTIEIAEQLFYHDSEMIVSFIDMIEGEDGEELRWLFALRAMDSLLNSFTIKSEDKIQLLEQLKTGFGKEFGMSRPLKKQLDDKFRKERTKIEEFMVFTEHTHPDYKPILALLERKEKLISTLVEVLIDYDGNGDLEVPINDLVSSYLHMLMNRIFTTKNRLHELVCYDFLFRYQRSLAAKMRKKTAELTKLEIIS